MTTYYTLENKQIPQKSIVKTYKKGSCDYQTNEECPRCFGRGIYGNHGVCFKCSGNGKVIVKKKGYTKEALITAQQEKAAKEAQEQTLADEYNKREEERAKLEKKTDRLYELITKGGKRSDFAYDLANQLVRRIHRIHRTAPLTEKQLLWVEKFINLTDYPKKEECITWLKEKNK